MISSLGELAGPVARRMEQLSRERVVERIWERDASIWPGDAAAIRDRLGWLTLADTMQKELVNLRRFAEQAWSDGFETTVVLGMGGSSFAPGVLAHLAPRPLLVLDSTHPESIETLREQLTLESTLFVVSSKSGTTLETLSLFEYFWAQAGEQGRRFVAVTDEGSPLEATGRDREFRRVFRNPKDVGGRFSALSFFGLVPAALAGADLEQLLGSARDMFRRCRSVDATQNPGAWLGAALGEAALAGRDKLALPANPELPGLEGWVEQLIAESTGKGGVGILPVLGDSAPSYLEAPAAEHLFLVHPNAATRPIPSLSIPAGVADLGAQFAQWEFATAVASHILGIEPFDQSAVQSAKDATAEALRSDSYTAETVSLTEAFAAARPTGYVALLAYVPDTEETRSGLAELQSLLGRRYGTTVTVGFGPRYLHSTGQFHKAGPPGGVFVVLQDDVGNSTVPVPARPYDFGRLISAQAEGDLVTLAACERVVTRSTIAGLKRFLDD